MALAALRRHPVLPGSLQHNRPSVPVLIPTRPDAPKWGPLAAFGIVAADWFGLFAERGLREAEIPAPFDVTWHGPLRVLFAVVAVAALCRPREAAGVHWREMGRRWRFTAKAAVGFFAAALALGALSWWVMPRYAALPVRFQSMDDFWNWVLLFVVVSPIAEEPIYRGLLFPVLQRAYGMWPAILLNGLIFGAMHAFMGIPFVFLGSYAIAGAAIAWLFARTQSLWCVTAFHLAANAATAGVGLWAYLRPGDWEWIG